MKNSVSKNSNLQFDQYNESEEGNDQREQTETHQSYCKQSDGGTKMSNQVTILVKFYNANLVACHKQLYLFYWEKYSLVCLN